MEKAEIELTHGNISIHLSLKYRGLQRRGFLRPLEGMVYARRGRELKG